jgi:hypothetical protein
VWHWALWRFEFSFLRSAAIPDVPSQAPHYDASLVMNDASLSEAREVLGSSTRIP